MELRAISVAMNAAGLQIRLRAGMRQFFCLQADLLVAGLSPHLGYTQIKTHPSPYQFDIGRAKS